MAAAAPYIVAAIGTAASINAQQEAAGERRRILNNQMTQNEQATGKAIDLVQKEAQNYGADARQQALAAQEQAAYDQAAKDLKLGAGGSAIDAAGGASNVSADFLKAKTDRELGEATRLSAVAREAAKTRAPALLGQQDSLRRANLAGNLQNIFGGSRNMSAAAGLDASAVEEPLYGALGQAAAQFGSAYLGSQGAAGAAAKTKLPSGGIQFSGNPMSYAG